MSKLNQFPMDLSDPAWVSPKMTLKLAKPIKPCMVDKEIKNFSMVKNQLNKVLQ